MADIVKNSYFESKQYQRLIFQRGKDLADFELNELQDIQRVQRRRTFASIFGHGFVGSGFEILPSANPNEILIRNGDALIQGEFINNPVTFPISGLTTPGAPRVDIVYLEAREVEIDFTQDNDIGEPGVGELARRVKLEWEVKVDEGSSTLPPTTGDLHSAGIHRELIGFLNRPASPTIGAADIIDSRRIIGFFFLNEDKSLEIVGGGDVNYFISGGAGLGDPASVQFGAPIRIIQPSTPGHGIIPITQSPIALNAGQVAYVLLDRDATTDYNLNVLVTSWNTLPNNPNALPIFWRSSDDNKLYASEGTEWTHNSTHPMRVNPFTGLIFDADVSPLANLNGAKIAVASIPVDRIIPPFPDTLTSGLVALSFDPSGTCPSGYTKLSLGTDDTAIEIATAGAPSTTPSGSNTHNHGTHSHGPGSFRTQATLLDLQGFVFGPMGGFFDGFSAGTGNCGFIGCAYTATFNVIGTSDGTTLSTVDHRGKRVRATLCQKN